MSDVADAVFGIPDGEFDTRDDVRAAYAVNREHDVPSREHAVPSREHDARNGGHNVWRRGTHGSTPRGDLVPELLGRTLAGIVFTLDPEVVVLMGEGMDAWEHLRPGFEPALRRCLAPTRAELPVVVEPWNEDKWARGAASLALASPFDATGNGGEQSSMVRARFGYRAAEAAR